MLSITVLVFHDNIRELNTVLKYIQVFNHFNVQLERTVMLNWSPIIFDSPAADRVCIRDRIY